LGVESPGLKNKQKTIEVWLPTVDKALVQQNAVEPLILAFSSTELFWRTLILASLQAELKDCC